jgi:hypothetical protein
MFEYISFLLNWFREKKGFTVVKMVPHYFEGDDYHMIRFYFSNPPPVYSDGWGFPFAKHDDEEAWARLLQWAKDSTVDE